MFFESRFAGFFVFLLFFSAVVRYPTQLHRDEAGVLLDLARSQRAIRAYTDRHLASMVCIPSPSFTNCVSLLTTATCTPSTPRSGQINPALMGSDLNLSVARTEMQQRNVQNEELGVLLWPFHFGFLLRKPLKLQEQLALPRVASLRYLELELLGGDQRFRLSDDVGVLAAFHLRGYNHCLLVGSPLPQ